MFRRKYRGRTATSKHRNSLHISAVNIKEIAPLYRMQVSQWQYIDVNILDEMSIDRTILDSLKAELGKFVQRIDEDPESHKVKYLCISIKGDADILLLIEKSTDDYEYIIDRSSNNDKTHYTYTLKI